MNRYEHFGMLLRELRESRNITREQLAQNICTPKQIYRIEKGEYEPSLYLLNQLSIKFNMDLNEYFKTYFSNQSIIGLEGIKNINLAIENNDLSTLKELIEQYEGLDEFKHGENLQHVLYSKALIFSLVHKDYHMSIEYSLNGIKIENPDFNITNITSTTYSNVGLALLNCLGLNYISLNESKIGIKILQDLLFVLDNYIIQSPYPMFHPTEFSKKVYQNTLYNLSTYSFKIGDISRSLNYVDAGINFSLKEYNFRFLPELLNMKLKILYTNTKYIEALDYYNRIVSLYKIMNQEHKLLDFTEKCKYEFPELFHETTIK